MSGSYSDTLKLTPRPPIRTELSHHMTMLIQSRARVQVMWLWCPMGRRADRQHSRKGKEEEEEKKRRSVRRWRWPHRKSRWLVEKRALQVAEVTTLIYKIIWCKDHETMVVESIKSIEIPSACLLHKNAEDCSFKRDWVKDLLWTHF